jgi:hypothetical protein
VYEKVNIFTILLDISVIHNRSVCGALWWLSYRPFLFWKTYGDWQRYFVSYFCGKFSGWSGAPLEASRRDHASPDMEFLDTRFEVFMEVKNQIQVFCVVTPCSVAAGYQRFGGPCCLHILGHNPEDLDLKGVSWPLLKMRGIRSLAPCSPDFTPLIFSGVLHKTMFVIKVQNENERWDRIATAKGCVTNEIFVNTWRETELRHMCVVSLMVPIVTSTENIRNFVRSNVWKCIDFCNMLYGWRYTTFHFTVGHLYCCKSNHITYTTLQLQITFPCISLNTHNEVLLTDHILCTNILTDEPFFR